MNVLEKNLRWKWQERDNGSEAIISSGSFVSLWRALFPLIISNKYSTDISAFLCEDYVSITDEIYIKEIGLCAEGWPMVIGVRSCNKKEKNTHLPNSCCVQAKTKSIIIYGCYNVDENGRNFKYCIHLGDSVVEAWIIAPKSETMPAQQNNINIDILISKTIIS